MAYIISFKLDVPLLFLFIMLVLLRHFLDDDKLKIIIAAKIASIKSTFLKAAGKQIKPDTLVLLSSMGI